MNKVRTIPEELARRIAPSSGQHVGRPETAPGYLIFPSKLSRRYGRAPAL